MISNRMIYIKSVQNIGNDSDNIDFSTEGRYGYKNGEYFISYDDGAFLDGKETVKTVFHIRSDRSVTIERTGEVNHRMVIEEGKRNTCFYSIPQGEFSISIFGEKIEYDLDSEGGKIYLEYTIDSEMNLISHNTVEITVSSLI